ncbi:MAG: hypothetical protein WD638_02095 [Nitriliruptoraceae bacterium]
MRIAPPPTSEALAATLTSWRLLAAHVLAEERFLRVGHSGLEPTPEGFRTPVDEPVGVELVGDQLVVRRSDGTERLPVTTLGAAQQAVLDRVGPPSWGEQPGLHDPPEPVAPDTALPIDRDVGAWLGGWLTAGYRALGALVADPDSREASVPTLWPEHFDVGIDLLEGGRRGSYGVSPGDAAISEPYAYVAVWYPDRVGGLDDPRWNSSVLEGAVLTAGELDPAVDADAQLVAWFRARRDLLLAAGED